MKSAAEQKPQIRPRMDIPAAVCTVCAKPYIRFNSMEQIVCSVRCAQRIPVINRKAERAERKATKQKLDDHKPMSHWIALTQKDFNAYIRARDAGKPCICCGRFSAPGRLGGEFDAGHYRSRGAASHLRFDESNTHAQLKHCNRYAFDVSAFRLGLIGRIGLAEVERLEADNTARRYSRADLAELRATYKAKLRELQA